MIVRTKLAHPPTEIPDFDWVAIDDTCSGSDCPIGYGRTEQEAVADLLEQIAQSGPTVDAP